MRVGAVGFHEVSGDYNLRWSRIIRLRNPARPLVRYAVESRAWTARARRPDARHGITFDSHHARTGQQACSSSDRMNCADSTGVRLRVSTTMSGFSGGLYGSSTPVISLIVPSRAFL